ncbi:MAG: coproporphyrinogen dehydrogenase HemZ [Corallococcus sp.]|nr:coproporphyrinogen dehydrogenase HemZ [Corallococcus sp.]
MKVYTNFEYPTEVLDVVKLYFANSEQTDSFSAADLVHCAEIANGVFTVKCSSGNIVVNKERQLTCYSNLQAIRWKKRIAKIAAYECLVKMTGIHQPWGCLTGIRPTKLAYQLEETEQYDYHGAFETLFDVSGEKIALVEQILEQQKGLRVVDSASFDLYVGVPFCVSRCSYCSFTSGVISKLQNYVKPYVDTVCNEIDVTLNIAAEKGLKLRNVYVGGGTPTALSYMDLHNLLNKLSKLNAVEFSVEAGRPDTIDSNKLQVMADCGVTRISINPQTFNQTVLDVIGRSHSVTDIYDKYELARKYSFKINMDLIAGLPSETLQMFEHSVDEAESLCPENITVHTLALKRGSVLKDNFVQCQCGDVKLMTEYAHKRLLANKYFPYYMYRQKYMADNLENVGYCHAGDACLYNVDIMEETTSILACGTNAISKRVVYDENRIERVANPKDIITYLEKADAFIDKKKKLFEM